MFKEIKIRFIVLSMGILFILLSSIIVSMNVINYRMIVEETDQLLSLMAENNGKFPIFKGKKFPRFISKETPYETRFFSVVINQQGALIETDTSSISSVDVDTAYEYAIVIMSEGKERGFIGDYRYICYQEEGLWRITFLDCGRKIYSFRMFRNISVTMGIAGYISFFVVILFFSGKIMRPVAESYEKQRQFITDAGHEIKTPLTIINADVDALELDFGENEWLEDIHKQVKRLTSLTNDLVFLSRMEEERSMHMIEFPFSDLVLETVSSFHSLARTQNKNLLYTIPPMLSLIGDEKTIRQLINILIDNALKYSPQQGVISVDVQKQRKYIMLTVCNTTQMPIPKDKLDMIFERFYRVDASRNSKTGGHGIGLSVAKAIVKAHNGKIYASSVDGNQLMITVCLPI